MPRVNPALRRGVCLACLWVLLFGIRAHAAGHAVIADFDGDGRSDHVSLDARDAAVVRIWFSASQTTQIIRSPQPLRGITAADLNGDHRPELIASTRSHGLQVWVKAHTGFRRYGRKRSPPSRGISHPGRHRVNDNDGSPAAAIGGAKQDPVSVAIALHRRSLVPGVRRDAPDVRHAARSALDESPFAPRPPPGPAS